MLCYVHQLLAFFVTHSVWGRLVYGLSMLFFFFLEMLLDILHRIGVDKHDKKTFLCSADMREYVCNIKCRLCCSGLQYIGTVFQEI